MITKYLSLLKFVQPTLGKVNKFYIIIYIFLYMIITKNQAFLKIILFIFGKLDFSGIYHKFLFIIIPPKAR